MNNNKDAIETYKIYFSEDIAAIEEELAKSKKYSEIIDTEINKLSETVSIGANKGNQRYLIEHITNAVALQSQRQSLRKDKVALKKMILDFANKDNKDDNGSSDIEAAIEKLIKIQKEQIENVSIVNTNNIDDDIDSILDKEEE